MATTKKKDPSTERLSIRASARQKRLLIQAAVTAQVPLTDFVLNASITAAEKLLKEESTLALDANDYEWLNRLLDEEPAPTPKLKRALDHFSISPESA